MMGDKLLHEFYAGKALEIVCGHMLAIGMLGGMGGDDEE